MAYIIPFKGVIYNKKKVGNLTKVVAPPYDIIPKDMQDDLYRSSPYNIVRLELGKMKRTDSASDNRYTRAQKAFDSWLKNNMMIRDEEESIYIYSQKYKEGAKYIDRIGFIALMALDEGRNKVLPHEKTLLAPKLDRLSLTRSVKANLSPIFVLYEDSRKAILNVLKKASSAKKPFIDVSFEGIRNRAWRLSDGSDIKKVQSVMNKAVTFIADGHHRFEVSRMYSKEIRNSSASKELKESSGYVMVYFVEANEDMLTVLPAHRLPKDIGGLTGEEILGRLHKFFAIERAGTLKAMMAKLKNLRNAHAFGVYMGVRQFYVLKLKGMDSVNRIIKDKSKDWKRLDVAILHQFIFQHVLEIRDDDDNVEFVKSPLETAKSVDSGEFKIAFFLNPTKVSEVKRIARLGEKMPRKATYFYPKPISGVVINKYGS